MADGPCHLPLHLLESMTNNFSKGRILGSGSYGKVYLGEREDGQKIAVKILHDMPGHDDMQFDKEFYNLVNLQHQNIVQLVGYCHETRREYLPYNEPKVLADVTKRALCFEFMENGSLSDCLSDEFNGHDWRKRYAIIKGICNGLKYLHEELKPPIFHLDLKPANILLDKNMIPKIADFGLSRFFKEEKSHITNSPLGTYGYLPPEFINQNIISNKLDIFSLGVVIIKIMTGPKGRTRSAEMTSEKFIENVHGNWRNRLQSAVSGDLLESYSEQVKRCVEIALSCVEADRQKRPTTGDIVNMLTETETQENYQGALIDQEREKGNEFFKQQKYPEAVKHYTEALRRNSNDPKLYSNRAACYTKLGAMPEGLKDAEKCIELDPTFCKGYTRKGVIQFFMKEYDKAMETYQEGLKHDPSNLVLLDGVKRCIQQINKANRGELTTEELKERQGKAMQDPEIQNILTDPLMRQVLIDFQENPRAAQEHAKNPSVMQKIQKLVSAGIVQIK